MNELPTNLAGYQHIESGYIKHGDIWVQDGKPLDWAMPTYQYRIEEITEYYRHNSRACRIYRKMNTPRNLH